MRAQVLCAVLFAYGTTFGGPRGDIQDAGLGYLYGITSEQRLAEECSLHLCFRWYLGYDLDEDTPNHSVLSKARRRYDHFGKAYSWMSGF